MALSLCYPALQCDRDCFPVHTCGNPTAACLGKRRDRDLKPNQASWPLIKARVLTTPRCLLR